jgi:hypothetical protein
MKTIRKNFLLLAFAAGALFLIGNNVMADPTTIIADPGDQGGGSEKLYQSMGYCGNVMQLKCITTERPDICHTDCP